MEAGESKPHKDSVGARKRDLESNPTIDKEYPQPSEGNGAAANTTVPDHKESGSEDVKPFRFGWREWVIFWSLCCTMLLGSIDATITTVALPTILRELNSSSYAWIVNAYTLSCMVFLLFIGQMADIFERKPTMLVSVFMFIVGSAVCGAAQNMGMLIGGRVIQGVGGGSIPVMSELICSDMVPIVERPKYLGSLLAIASLGTVIGPPVGGAIVANISWRWIFLINVPPSGLAFLLLFMVLRMKDKVPDGERLTFRQKLGKVDWIGNSLFAGSSTSFILGLTMGGNTYPWGSPRVITPIVIGVVGFVVFAFYEKWSKIEAQILPSRLINNYTAVAIYIQGACVVFFLGWIIYFLPLYFQTVLAESQTRAGVELLPLIICTLPFAMLGGFLMSKLKAAKELHMAGLAIITIGVGCFSLFTESSSLAMVVLLQIVVAIGSGLLMSTLLPAVQSQLPEADVAAVTALFNFARSFGGVWAITIPSVIFNNQINRDISRVADKAVQALLMDGGAYKLASKAFIASMTGVTKIQVISLYTSALRITWIGAAAFSGAAFFLAAFEKRIRLKDRNPHGGV